MSQPISTPNINLETLRCEISKEYAEVARNPAKALLEAELKEIVAAVGFQNFELTWREDVFSGAPQQTSAAKFGTLGINFRARKPLDLQ